ncbi:MAG: DUF4129 domain-containing protein [Pseudonocardia sp.]
MSDQRDPRHPSGTSVFRVGGIAVLVVLAVVLARARASGMTPPAPVSEAWTAMRSITQIGAITVLVAGVILLISYRRVRSRRAAVVRRRRAQMTVRSRRQLLIAVLVGLLIGMASQLFGGTPPEPPPAPPSAENVQDDTSTQRNPGEQGRREEGLGDRIVLVASLLTLAVLLLVLMRRGQPVDDEDDPDDEDDDEQRVTKAVRAAREAVLDRRITDPREAIVACFAAMEEALAERGEATAPHESDTPEEVLTRGVQRASLPEPPAGTLLRLFREARFSTHPMVQQDREEADGALAALLAALGGRPVRDPAETA